ncbi:hypothetical protein M153_397000927 [Pseudoloma neurophilia]|uniref:Uncharacterized protein n=1 Tax=Pseudoloma neurophilia TaxID=146866 RepID=A0A0R0LXM8_9MICR|nr:hypothetical protein M153_397000927 [Pseudoloma neurophilia]
MNYLNEKIKFLNAEKDIEKTKEVNLKKITSLINSIKFIKENNISKTISEMQALDLGNFLQDIFSSILNPELQSINVKMLLIFNLSLSYLESDDLLLSQLREKMRNNMKKEMIITLSLLYAEICASHIEIPIKFEIFISKTFSNKAFGEFSLKNMYELAIFFKSQVSKIELLDEESQKNAKSLVEFYDKNFIALKNAFIKMHDKNFDTKNRNLLFSLFGLSNISQSFQKITELTVREKKFYQITEKIEDIRDSKSNQKLTTDEIIKNIRSTIFLVKNLNRSQKTSSFIISLIYKTTDLKFLAKLAVCANIEMETALQSHFKGQDITKNVSFEDHDEHRILLFVCELFKFHHFDRKMLMTLLKTLFQNEKYELLTNCLDRVGRFLLDEAYSQDGNTDIIELILNIEKKLNDVDKIQKKLIKNCIKRLFISEEEQIRENQAFITSIFQRKNDMQDFLESFTTLLKGNKLFAMQMFLEYCILSTVDILYEFLSSLAISDNEIEDLILLTAKSNENHRSIIIADVYGFKIAQNISENDFDHSSFIKFLNTVLNSSVIDIETRFELVITIIENLNLTCQKVFIGFLDKFVQQHDNRKIYIRFVNFCQLHQL